MFGVPAAPRGAAPAPIIDDEVLDAVDVLEEAAVDDGYGAAGGGYPQAYDDGYSAQPDALGYVEEGAEATSIGAVPTASGEQPQWGQQPQWDGGYGDPAYDDGAPLPPTPGPDTFDVDDDAIDESTNVGPTTPAPRRK
jgi:hypothetical protein